LFVPTPTDGTTGDHLLLLTLREVSELVSNSHDIRQTSDNIVALIQSRFRTDVCSLYEFERSSGTLVLRATRGLKTEGIDELRLAPSEGLVGLAFETREPVNVADAAAHARYHYFPGSGEEQFPAFLGVPLISAGATLGVLVVQHRITKPYPANFVSLMVGVAAQLATLFANARLTQELSDSLAQARKADGVDEKPSEIHGVAACPGTAFGKALKFEAFDFDNPDLIARRPGTVAEELSLLDSAIEQGRSDLIEAAEHLAQLLGEEFGALMQAQRLLLEDATVRGKIKQFVETGLSVEQAVVKVGGDYLRAFERIENPMFLERLYDIKDVFRRVLMHACPTGRRTRHAEAVIVVAHEVSLLELFASDVTRVRGIVVEKGGAFSHVAILARSLGVPMLTQAHRVLRVVDDGDDLFLDAASGTVSINPAGKKLETLQRLLQPDDAQAEDDAPAGPLPIRLEGTVNLLPEVARSVRNGAEGIGLYRSEFLQLARRVVPTEEEQLEVYRKMIHVLGGLPLTIRTLDLRADKLFRVAEQRPHEGQWEWRLVADCSPVQEIIRVQLRAILRASDDGPIRILFPMIATQRQLECALRLLDEAKRSLRSEGLPFASNTPVGFMIEVPAAVMMVKRWVPTVDFVSIGSNDLLHSLLGIDRDSDVLAHLKTPLEPTYLRAVRHVVKYARAAGKPVTVCGEAASYPRAALALAALGVTSLSVPPDNLAKVRREFASVTVPPDLEPIGRRLGRASEITDVERILDQGFPRRRGG
jgi:phosphotransferase system enzyme I (PtsP)